MYIIEEYALEKALNAKNKTTYEKNHGKQYMR